MPSHALGRSFRTPPYLDAVAAWRLCPLAALQNLRPGHYVVQSADFFGDEDPAASRRFERQLVELLREQCLQQRCDRFDSIKEAILARNRDFAGLNDARSGRVITVA